MLFQLGTWKKLILFEKLLILYDEGSVRFCACKLILCCNCFPSYLSQKQSHWKSLSFLACCSATSQWPPENYRSNEHLFQILFSLFYLHEVTSAYCHLQTELSSYYTDEWLKRLEALQCVLLVPNCTPVAHICRAQGLIPILDLHLIIAKWCRALLPAAGDVEYPGSMLWGSLMPMVL